MLVKCKKIIFLNWKTFAIFLIPILLLPIAIIDGTVTFRCAYVALVMAFFWMLELLPLPVTSLIPVAVFPLLGIMPTEDVSMCYMKETCMLYLGGLMLAIAVEDCNLHHRIALHVLQIVGASPRFLLLGFMLPTAFLSMWISNTAACAMMIPILDAMLGEVLAVSTDSDTDKPKVSPKNMRAMLAMSVCYAANIGGTATTIGTGPNLVLMGYLNEFDGQPINFSSWIGFALPQMLLCLFLIWIYLQFYYLPLPTFKNITDDIEIQQKQNVAKLIRDKIHGLGPFSFQEKLVSASFLVLIFLWFFRSPGFISGWGDELGGSTFITDGTPAVLMAIVLFLLPSNTKFNTEGQPISHGLITWNTVEKNLPWGVLLLFGGGFALAEGCQQSKLSDWIGSQLSGLTGLNEWTLIVILCVLASILTQIVSNVTTATIITPIVRELAIELNINPLLLMIPPSLVCSYGFMLPVSSAPNTMAYQISGMTTYEMARLGIGTTLVCIAVVILSIMSYGYLMFDLGTFPEWAKISFNQTDLNV